MGILAAQPVFLDSAKDVWEAVRLSGVDSTDSDAADIMRQALLDSRNRLYRRLGEARVAQLLETDLTGNPATQAERDRAQAMLLEVWLVKKYLLETLPTLFKDGSSGLLSQINDEALVRDVDDQGGFDKVLERLCLQIEVAFAELDDDDDTLATGVSGRTFEVENAIRLEPGGSVRACPRNPWLRPATDSAQGARAAAF